MSTLANSEDPDEMPHNVTFHQGVHCLLRHTQSSKKEIQYYLEIIICDPSIYRSTSLCQTCLSRIHGLCRSDHPFPNFSPLLHCNSTLLMSNSVIMKTRLFRSDFSFAKANFPFVYHCLYRSGQKVKRSE